MTELRNADKIKTSFLDNLSKLTALSVASKKEESSLESIYKRSTKSVEEVMAIIKESNLKRQKEKELSKTDKDYLNLIAKVQQQINENEKLRLATEVNEKVENSVEEDVSSQGPPARDDSSLLSITNLLQQDLSLITSKPLTQPSDLHNKLLKTPKENVKTIVLDVLPTIKSDLNYDENVSKDDLKIITSTGTVIMHLIKDGEELDVIERRLTVNGTLTNGKVHYEPIKLTELTLNDDYVIETPLPIDIAFNESLVENIDVNVNTKNVTLADETIKELVTQPKGLEKREVTRTINFIDVNTNDVIHTIKQQVLFKQVEIKNNIIWTHNKKNGKNKGTRFKFNGIQTAATLKPFNKVANVKMIPHLKVFPHTEDVVVDVYVADLPKFKKVIRTIEVQNLITNETFDFEQEKHISIQYNFETNEYEEIITQDFEDVLSIDKVSEIVDNLDDDCNLTFNDDDPLNIIIIIDKSEDNPEDDFEDNTEDDSENNSDDDSETDLEDDSDDDSEDDFEEEFEEEFEDDSEDEFKDEFEEDDFEEELEDIIEHQKDDELLAKFVLIKSIPDKPSGKSYKDIIGSTFNDYKYDANVFNELNDRYVNRMIANMNKYRRLVSITSKDINVVYDNKDVDFTDDFNLTGLEFVKVITHIKPEGVADYVFKELLKNNKFINKLLKANVTFIGKLDISGIQTKSLNFDKNVIVESDFYEINAFNKLI